MTENSRGWKEILFSYRSYTPVPFLIVMLIYARPTALTMTIGFVAALVGEAVRFWGVSYAGSETRTTGTVGGSKLVVTGPYAYMRNPLYAGNIILYTGIGIMSNALVPYLQLIALAYFAFQYRAIVSLEEGYLGQTFPEWNEYAQHVPRFFPILRKYVSNQHLNPDFKKALRSERSSILAFSAMTFFLLMIMFLRGSY
ncbi:MAG: methyltransferase family protein [Candidatus Kryptoniota bacterium]